MAPSVLYQLLWNGLAAGSIFAIVSLGFALIYYTTRTLHLAHGIIYTISGYLFFSAITSLQLPILIAGLIGITGAVCVGVLTELLIYRPLFKRNAPAAIPLIASLGVYIILQNLLALLFGNHTRILNAHGAEAYVFGEVVLSRIQVLGFASLVLVALSYYLTVKYTRFGKTLKAISSNTVLAEVIGIDIKRYRLIVFALGSALAGVGAILSLSDVGTDPNVGFSAVLIAIVAIIIGGVGNFGGAILGGLLLGLLHSFSSWVLSSKWQSVVVFLILTAFLLFRPEGILGVKGRLEEKA